MTSTDQRFDVSVQRALEKWPNVPNCFGWVSLNRRGQWLIKDEQITHKRAIQFIERNYAHDEHGRWFVQNGPQRAFCDLEYTPMVYRLDIDSGISSHTNARCKSISAVILDDEGNLLLETNLGIGILDDRDLLAFCDLAVVQTAVGTSVMSESDFLDFEHVRTERLRGTNIAISFADRRMPLIAEYENRIAKEFGFSRKPQPYGEET
jgi:hypothetical protein